VNIDQTEWQTMVIGPYGSDPYTYTFPVLPQVQSGHTKVFPPRATVGPPDLDRDDTLTTATWMDLSGGQGIYVINPSTDMGRSWWSTADTRGTDGWTPGPEVVAARPSSYSGNFRPVGRIGVTVYGLWGTALHPYDPDDGTWGAAVRTVGTVAAGDYAMVRFMGRQYFVLTNGNIVSVTESSPGVISALTTITAAASPTVEGATTNPTARLITIHQQRLAVLTTAATGYHLAFNATGLTGEWFWPYDAARQLFPSVETSVTAHGLISWVDPATGMKALWCSTDGGCLIWNSDDVVWEETSLWNVPPHPNFGKTLKPFRPGESLWIAGGGGDVIQYTANGVVVPASGPGGRGHGLPDVGGRDGNGMPADRRGDVISMATDLANLYVLVQGDTVAGDPPDVVEETEGSDPLYLPEGSSTNSLIAYTGKGWHPLWEAAAAAGVPSTVVVDYGTKDNGSRDYRAFWGVGEDAWSMPCRLTTYSAFQGRKRGIDRFATSSYIEWGRYHAGSLAKKKLFSHVAIQMEHADTDEYAEFEYTTDADPDTWTVLGQATVAASRNVLPLGLTADGMFSEGLSCYWIQPRLRLVGMGGTSAPTVLGMTLAYLPLQGDANHMQYSIPLPVGATTCPLTGKTREQIHDLLHDLSQDNHDGDRFLFMQFNDASYRVVIAGISHVEVAAMDAPGAITLSVIQIPTGTGLVGDHL
jgi:hypothetical protein